MDRQSIEHGSGLSLGAQTPEGEGEAEKPDRKVEDRGIGYGAKGWVEKGGCTKTLGQDRRLVGGVARERTGMGKKYVRRSLGPLVASST